MSEAWTVATLVRGSIQLQNFANHYWVLVTTVITAVQLLLFPLIYRKTTFIYLPTLQVKVWVIVLIGNSAIIIRTVI
jgi:hypothetical protein